MKLTHNAIVSEASVDSTESFRTRMALQSCSKSRQWGQEFVPPHLQLLARGHQGKGIAPGEAFPSDRHVYVYSQQQSTLALDKGRGKSTTVSTIDS